MRIRTLALAGSYSTTSSSLEFKETPATRVCFSIPVVEVRPARRRWRIKRHFRRWRLLRHPHNRLIIAAARCRDDQQQELAEYQQKLAMGKEKSGQSQGGGKKGGEERMGLAGAIHGTLAETPPPPRDVALTIARPSAVTAALEEDLKGATVVPTAPAGLASLDFELPTDRNVYEVHRFTTPLGEAELTARTVSNRTLGKLELLAGIVAAGLLVWAAFGLIRRGVLGWFRRPLGAMLLVLAGLALFCGGVLPFAGLIAILVGIGLLIARFVHRRVATV